MCYLDLDSGRSRDWYGGERLAEAMRYLEEIKVFGGEPFFCETSRALILDADKPRWTHTSFLTNGMLVTDRVIDALEWVRIGSVDVSLDAADSATYERIRLHGKFAKALAGARRLVELSRRHRIRRFPVYADFVIQRRNYRSLEQFVGLCDDQGLTPNFTDVGITHEAIARAEQQGTELGTPPVDRDELLRHLDGALSRAESLRLDFAVASLKRVRTEALRQ
jgi:MoaA/NifB/PqqE/SkfB family radical SAM enzyme